MADPATTKTKLCFITVGATAPFNALLISVLSVPFLLELATHNYTHLRIQYGHGGETTFSNNCRAVKESYKFLRSKDSTANTPGNIEISGFALATDAETLKAEIRNTQASAEEDREEGLFISHAGTGSLLDGLLYGIPMILVPNPALADNHQEELARRFAKMHYCVHGDVDDLVPSVAEAEAWRREMQKPIRYQWEDEKREKGARKDKAKEIKRQKTLQDVMDQEMGYVQVD
jgi:beta-1,4-N-acetylglucosaminyltransferase